MGHLRRVRKKGPRVTRDLLVPGQIGHLSRCPKDGGLLVRIDEEMADQRCLTCGWRHYSMRGLLIIQRSLKRLDQEEKMSRIRGRGILPRIERGDDDDPDDLSMYAIT